MSDELKQCPYCAETIKAEAIVCRFCGKELTNVQSQSQTLEKKKRPFRKIILLLAGGLLIACCGIWGLMTLFSDPSDLDSSENASRAQSEEGLSEEDNPIPTTTPIPTAPPIEEILETVSGMTDAQRNNYNESIQGSLVEEWHGTVSEVDEGEILGGFTVIVDSVEENFGSEVYISVTEDVALSLNKDQEIEFSGVIDYVSDILGTTVHIEDATITPIE